MKRLLLILSLTISFIFSGCIAGESEKPIQEGEPNVTAPDRPMRILLINDDGYESEGLRLLADQLEERNFEVWSVAPTTNKSGAGTSISFNPFQSVPYTQIEGNHYHMEGTPSDCLLLGLTGLMAETPPDLVISGVNDGPNVGISQFNSGTVGGAARAVKHGFPAVAASVGFRMEEMKEGFPSTMKHIPDAVDFTVEVTEQLRNRWEKGQPILPEGTGISINYPAYPAAEIQGIAFTGNPTPASHQFVYELTEEGTAVPVLSEDVMNVPEEPDPDNDTDMLNHRYITIDTFQASWGADEADRKAVEESLSGLSD